MVCELVELGVSARRAHGHGTVRVYGVDGHFIEAPLESRQLFGRRAEAELERVEAQFEGLVDNRRTVRETSVVPVGGKRETHAAQPQA